MMDDQTAETTGSLTVAKKVRLSADSMAAQRVAQRVWRWVVHWVDLLVARLAVQRAHRKVAMTATQKAVSRELKLVA